MKSRRLLLAELDKLGVARRLRLEGPPRRRLVDTPTRSRTFGRADPGLDAARRPLTVPHDPLTAIRQGILGMARDEGVGLGAQRRRKYAPRPVARVLGQRVLHGSGQVEAG